jgi:hypothetical protein
LTPVVAFLLTLACIIAPIRWCITKCVNTDDSESEDKQYIDLVHAFPTDYDKENPLTVKQGQLRMLELQIKKAKESGDENALAMLQNQKQGIAAGPGGVFAQMQQYHQQSMARHAQMMQAHAPLAF